MSDKFFVCFAITTAWFIVFSGILLTKATDASEFSYYSSANFIPQETFVEDPRYKKYISQQYGMTDRANNDVRSKKYSQDEDIDRLDHTDKLRILVTGGAGFIGKST